VRAGLCLRWVRVVRAEVCIAQHSGMKRAIVGCLLFAAALPAQEVDVDLLAYVKGFAEERFCAEARKLDNLPANGDAQVERSGWFSFRVEVRTGQKPPIAVMTERRRDVEGGAVERSETAYELFGEGRVLWGRTRHQQGTEMWLAEAQRTADGKMRRTIKYGDEVSVDEVIPHLRDTLRSQLAARTAFMAGDDTEQVTYAATLLQENPEAKLSRRLVKLDMPKDRATYIEVDVEVDGFLAKVWMDMAGQPHKWESRDGVHSGVYVDRETALYFPGCYIPVFLVIPAPKRVAKATLIWRDCHFDDWPTTRCQKWVKQEDGTVTFELTRDRAVAADAAAELALADRKSYLRPSKLFNVTDPDMVKLAAKLVAGEKNVVKAARLLVAGVRKRLDFKGTTQFTTATEALERGHGDCKDYTVLFVTLARAAGIPTRTVQGYAYGGDCEPRSFGGHTWAEVHDGRQWVSVDPTHDQVFVAATHIAQSFDELERGPETISRDLTLESFELEPEPKWWQRFK
jgi:hypothetical protein